MLAFLCMRMRSFAAANRTSFPCGRRDDSVTQAGARGVRVTGTAGALPEGGKVA